MNGNTFNPREFDRPGRIVFNQCQDCIFSNNTLRALNADDGAVIVRNSLRLSLTDNILTESSGGVLIENSKDLIVKDWIVSGLPAGKKWISKDEKSKGIVESGILVTEQGPKPLE